MTPAEADRCLRALWCWRTAAALGEYLKVTKKTARVWAKKLYKQGLLERGKRRQGLRGPEAVMWKRKEDDPTPLWRSP